MGQGRLYRTYDDLLREQGIPTAQILLTFFDMSARTHYLNARRTLQTLLGWRVVPVINENDTTTTDEISFGDNDFLAAQVAVLLGAELLVLLTDTDGLYTANPRVDPGARLVEEVGATRRSSRGSRSGTRCRRSGSGGMRSKVVAAEMATAAGIPTVIASGLQPGVLGARVGGRARRHAVRAPGRPPLELQAVAQVREADARDADRRRGRRAGAARRRHVACCRSGSSTSRASSTPATPSRCARRAPPGSARGSSTTRRPSCAA